MRCVVKILIPKCSDNKKTMLTLDLKLKSMRHLEILGHENVYEVPWDFSAQYLR